MNKAGDLIFENKEPNVFKTLFKNNNTNNLNTNQEFFLYKKKKM
jgi:hypothetical protein